MKNLKHHFYRESLVAELPVFFPTSPIKLKLALALQKARD